MELDLRSHPPRLLRRPTVTRLFAVAAVVLALAMLGSVGCGGDSSSSTRAAPGPGETSASSDASTASTTAALPDGWKTFEGETIALALPSDWQTKDFSTGDLEAMFEELKASSPELADIIGDASALEGVEFWAFGPADENAVFVDNLNIRRQSREGDTSISTPDDLLPEIKSQYEDLGFTVGTSTGGLTVAGNPATYLQYEAPFTTDDGTQSTVTGEQYFVLTDADLWVLTYTFGPDSTGPADGVAKLSAESTSLK